VTSKVKGQGNKVMSSVWYMFAHKSTTKKSQKHKWQECCPCTVLRLTFCTSFKVRRSMIKVKVTRLLRMAVQVTACSGEGRGHIAVAALSTACYWFVLLLETGGQT